MNSRKIFRYLLAGFSAMFLVVFLLLPVFTVVETGCDWRLIVEVFRNQVYVDGLVNSLLIALTTTAMVFVISVCLALLYDKYDFPGRDWCGFLMLLPMILPPFVGALGFQQILGHYGVINQILVKCGLARVDFLGGEGRFWSVCLIEALHLYPIFYLNLVATLGNIDPAFDEAAVNFGASRTSKFFHITLPLLKPGILAGGSLVLVWSFTELGTPLMFGYTKTTAVQILNGLTELESNPIPYALVLIMLTASIVIYAAAKALLGNRGSALPAKGMTTKSRTPAKGVSGFLILGAFLLVTLFAVLPHIALILRSFTAGYYQEILPTRFTLANYREALSNPLVIPSVVNSLRYSLLATVIAVICGVVVSLASCRWKLAGSKVLDLLFMLPLAVPGVVVAFGFLGMSVKFDFFAEYFNPVENPLFLLAVAYAVRRIPYVVRSVSSGLEQTPEDLELAAGNLGAKPWRVVAKIAVPLVAVNILIGGLFAFSFSMLEVSDSLILAQKEAYFPITRSLYELSQILGSGSNIASAFGVWAMLFLATTLALAGVMLGRKIGSVFRF